MKRQDSTKDAPADITHIMDPDGEVIIVLRNANAPFAPVPQKAFTGENLDGITRSSPQDISY